MRQNLAPWSFVPMFLAGRRSQRPPGLRRGGACKTQFTTVVQQGKEPAMKGIAAWLLGIPIPVIILLYFLDVF